MSLFEHLSLFEPPSAAYMHAARYLDGPRPAGPSLPLLLELLLKLYPLRQPLLSRSVSDVLFALVSSPRSHVSPAQLEGLAVLLLDGEGGGAVAVAGARMAQPRPDKQQQQYKQQ
jgi:hypothetical protein